MPFRWSMGCCCAECHVLLDEFDRSDSDDMGDNWNEVSGDWDILGSNAYSNTSASLCLTTGAATDGTSQKLTVSLRFGTTSGSMAVVFAYEDSNNYCYVEFDYDAATVTVYEVVAGGSPSSLGSASFSFIVATTYQFAICFWPDNGAYSGGAIVHVRSGSSFDLDCEGMTPEGGYAGIWNIDTTAIVSYFKHEETYYDNSLCDICLCSGKNVSVDQSPTIELDVTFAGVTSKVSSTYCDESICTNLSCQNNWNTTFTLRCIQSNSPDGITWTLSNVSDVCGGGSLNFNAGLAMSGSDYILTIRCYYTRVAGGYSSLLLFTYVKNFGTTKPDTHAWSSETTTQTYLDSNDDTVCCDLSPMTATFSAA